MPILYLADYEVVAESSIAGRMRFMHRLSHPSLGPDSTSISTYTVTEFELNTCLDLNILG